LPLSLLSCPTRRSSDLSLGDLLSRTDKSDEDVVQAGAVTLEAAQREALRGALLEQRAEVAAGAEFDVPVAPAIRAAGALGGDDRSEEHTSELQSRENLV